MKKILIFQAILLLLAVILGATLKADLTSEVRMFHRLAGMLAVVVGVVTVAMSFKTQQTSGTKMLTILTLFLTLSAGFGGASLSRANNYSFYYLLMVVSGILALGTNLALIYKLRSNQSK